MNFITLNLLSVSSHALQNQNRNKEEISERLPCVIEMHHRKYYGFSNVWDSAIHRIKHYPAADKYLEKQLRYPVIVYYPVDNAIQRLNNQGQVK